MGIKLNLGAGFDFRLNYINIDLKPTHESIIKGDFRDLSKINIKDNSVEEIICINSISYLHFSEILPVLKNWVSKLEPNGYIYIQSNDMNILGNMMGYDQITIEQLNEILFGKTGEELNKAIYSLPAIEALAKDCGCEIIEKGYAGISFFIKIKKKVINE